MTERPLTEFERLLRGIAGTPKPEVAAQVKKDKAAASKRRKAARKRKP